MAVVSLIVSNGEISCMVRLVSDSLLSWVGC